MTSKIQSLGPPDSLCPKCGAYVMNPSEDELARQAAEIARLRVALMEIACIPNSDSFRSIATRALAPEPACQYCARGLDLLEKGHLHHDGDGYVRCEKS